MSAFLGPIHYWLYNKIQIQDNIIEDILSEGKTVIPTLEAVLDTKYGKTEDRPLEEVIDTGNIHAWLQEQVSRSEYKLAFTVTQLLEVNPEFYDVLKEIFRNAGKKLSQEVADNNASLAYKMISDSLLDGMPCDRSLVIIESSDTETLWEISNCVHSSYWGDVGGNIETFYQLRDEFIHGILETTNLAYSNTGGNTRRIRRK